MEKSRKVIVTLGVTLVLCIVVIIVMLILWPNQKSNNVTEGEKITTTSNDTNNMENNEEVIKIDTPYCTLEYPNLWQKNLKYEEKEGNGVYSQTFYCCINEQEIEIFTIYFGKTEEGEFLGYIIKDDKKVAFSVDINTFDTDGTWTKKEKRLLDSMAEGVNDIISSVTSDENFSEE